VYKTVPPHHFIALLAGDPIGAGAKKNSSMMITSSVDGAGSQADVKKFSGARHQNTIAKTLVALLLMSIAAGHVVAAKLGDGSIEPGEDATAELTRAVQNPVANLISVPFQNNTSYKFGPRERTRNVMNIQPVIPLEINDEWNMITRTIFPIVSQPSFVRGQGRQDGLGDVLFTAFLSPKQPAFGSLIWGVGPVVNLPTASDDRLGADLWGAGLA
jgi:hypothetical protein